MLIRDKSGPGDPYFLAMEKALHAAGYAQPVLIIDRARLEQNIEQLIGDVPEELLVRIVAKSLPVPKLLELASRRLGTRSYMTFNLPMLRSIQELDPGADQLLGKPLPVAAASQFYSGAMTGKGDVYWLIDTNRRLQQYGELANSRKLKLDIVLELDVGLHRGGFEIGGDLERALEVLSRSDKLNFAGFMGYEAHIAKIPNWMGLRRRALHKAKKLFRQALASAEEILELPATRIKVRNAAGSPTFTYYQSTEIANEVSVGSVLVKPGDFDTDQLNSYQPAMFIATPALKVGQSMKTPFLEALDPVKRLFNPNLDKVIFIHGGNWKADPVDPPGLNYNSVFGRSSNQDILNGGPATSIEPDDFVFLRPTQSEAVMMQFGEIAIYEEGAIVDRWAPFETSV